MTYKCKTALVLFGLATLSACGGSGDGVASIPPPLPSPAPPPPPPPPPNDTSVELLATPATQEFAVATPDDPLQIRYDAARNVYEVKAGTFDWSAIIDPPGPSGVAANRSFQIAGQPDSSRFIIFAHHRSTAASSRYRYSNLATWEPIGTGREIGNVAAFGTATPASGVPVSGTASYQGTAEGQANLPADSNSRWLTTSVGGTVILNFDFAAGALTGSLDLGIDCENCTAEDSTTGTIAFKNTVFARGSQTFSGAFATGVSGNNAFDGRFTGPAAEELIGRWSLPIQFQGAAYQASGAWIAKRGN